MSDSKRQGALPPVSYSDATPEVQEIFDNLKKAIGRVPNLHAVFAHSPHVFKARLSAAAELDKGHFSMLEQEIINLASSQQNQCHYCIAAHSAVLKMLKLSEDEIMQIRRGTSSDEKHALLASLAAEITEKRGYVAEESIDSFFAAGYDRVALVEFVAIVALNTWNNFTNNITDTPMDWPAVPALD